MPSNSYYDSTGFPSTGALASSASLRAEFDAIEEMAKKLPDPTTADRAVFTSGTALVAKTASEARVLLGVPSSGDIPSLSTAGASKIIASDSSGTAWEYPSITTAGKAILDDASASDQLTTLGGTAAGKAIFTASDSSAQRTALSINNVPNVDCTNGSNIASGTVADARIASTLSRNSQLLGSTTYGTLGVSSSSGGTKIIVQGGTVSVPAGGGPITFAYAFPSTCFTVVCSNGNTVSGGYPDYDVGSYGISATGCTFTNTHSSSVQVNYIAMGY